MARKTLQRISVNEQLLNRYTRHAVFLQQLEKGEALRIGRFMKQNVFPSIFQKLMTELGKVKDIKTIGSARRIKRLNQMLASVKQTAIAGFVRAEKQAISRLVDVSRFEAQWNINTIERTVPLDISMVMPSNAVLRTLVTTKAFGGPDNQHKLDTWFKGLSRSVRNNVNKQLRVGIAAGESVPALGKRVQKAFSTGTKQAQAIARTMTSAVVHNAREEVFKANKAIVPKVQWTATLDDRTTVVCINLDGKVFETGKGPRPPIHFQCRSTVVPVTPSWQEFGVSDPPPGTRASMNGAVPDKVTYKQWFAKQSKSTQIKVLGKKKAELFRSGRVKIEKFSSRDLKPLTLKQIAARENVRISPAPPTTGVVTTPTEFPDRTSLEKIEDKWFKQLAPKERVAALDYKGSFYEEVNTALRENRGIRGYTPEKVQRFMINFEKAIDKSQPLQQNVIAYRGVPGSVASKLKVGNTYLDFGYQSTGARTTAIKFAEDEASGKTKYIFKFNLKKGLTKTATYGDEIVLNRGYASKVTSISKSGNVVTIEMDGIAVSKQVAGKTTVGTSFTNTVSSDFRNIVNEQIAVYPEKVKAALNNQGITYKIGDKMTNAFPELKGVHPTGWAKGTTFDSVEGLFHNKSKSISMMETYRPVGKKTFEKVSTLRARGGMNHETGHGFNHSQKVFFSDSQKFRDAYRNDVIDMPFMKRQESGYFLQRGARGRDETFAEIFADLMGQGAVSDKRELFPNVTRYIEDLLK